MNHEHNYDCMEFVIGIPVCKGLSRRIYFEKLEKYYCYNGVYSERRYDIRSISLRFSRNSEVFASEFPENLDEIILR